MRRWCCLILVLLPGHGLLADDDRPVIDDPTYAGQVSDQLRARRREARRAARRTDAAQTEAQKTVSAAMDQYLMLAETLLNRGDRIRGAMGSRMVIMGTTMLEGQPVIETILRPFSDESLPASDAARVRQDLVAFTQGVRAGLSTVPVSASGDLDAIMIGLLTPLRQACETTTGRSVPHGWWRDPAGETVVSTVTADLHDVTTLDLDEELLAELESVRNHETLRSSSIRLLSTMESHKWMDGLSKRGLRQSLQSALAGVNAGETSARDMEPRVEALQVLVDSIGGFAESPGGRPVASRRSKAIVELLDAWPERLPPEGPTRAIADSIDVLAAARAEEDRGLERLRARTHRALASQRMLAERRVFESFGDVARSEAPWTDPGLVVVLSEPRQLLEAMQRLRRLDTWLPVAEQYSPGQADRFTSRMEALITAMTEQHSREDAARALREFERQFAMFMSMEGEPGMAGSSFDPSGRLVRQLQQARGRWIDDWSRGRSAGDGGADLYRFLRFLQCVQLLESVDEAGLKRLDAWAAWELPMALLQGRRAQLRERLVEVAEALDQRDWDEADRFLRRIEESHSVLLLAGAVLQRAPASTGGDSRLTILGEMTDTPEPDSLLATHRDALARLGHALLEIEVLARQERVEEVEALDAWSAMEASRLLRRLNVRPAAPLAVPGMREAEAEQDRGGMEMMQ
ncbi:MAG: hypothetical protein MK116_09910 [Phycisphaerales bacterium]|nr:hypothetical protein [Phycisphaerales bacterium]